MTEQKLTYDLPDYELSAWCNTDEIKEFYDLSMENHDRLMTFRYLAHEAIKTDGCPLSDETIEKDSWYKIFTDMAKRAIGR